MIKELEKYGEVYEHQTLKPFNTYHIGGTCKYLISPNSVQDLIEILKILKKEKIKYLILGNGSNVVFNDREYDGAIIRLNKLNGLKVHPELQMVYAEAGVSLPHLVTETVNKSLIGLEFASGIPGTIGGAIYGNAGAYNSCIMDYVLSVTILDENYDIKVLDHEDIEYSYRHTMFKEHKEYIILAVKLFLKNGDKQNSLDIIEDRRRRRVSSQPLEYPSAGSVFRNPEGDFAGRLIESCNLKGYAIGGAEVSEKHANFIINKNNATGKNVHDLIKYVHDVVLNKTGVDLIVEQEFIDWE